ncbi:MAG: cohesin domain-containing protein, partial [Candidatus Poribacteria bacterium]|nr:cohesin domain-containing protein [Candidatus Poribacteria bacterium]
MIKTIVSLLILLTLFSSSTFAANYPRLKAILPGHQEGISSLSFSPDGSTLANTGFKKVFLWDVASRQLKATLAPDTQLSSNVVFSPDGSILANSGSGNNDKKIYLWDVASRQLKSTLTGHRAGVNSIAFSPDASTLASGGGYKDHTVRLWDVASGQTKTIFTEHTAGVNSIAFSPDGSTLASGSYDGTVRLWDVASRQLKTIFTGYAEEVWCVAFSPDGSILASCGGERYNDKKVYLWDVASRQLKDTLIGHTERVHSVAFSPNGSILASGSRDGTVRLWDIASGQFKAILAGFEGEVNSVTFSPDGSILASGGWNGDASIHLWDLTASATTSAVVSISPASVQPSTIGEQITVSLNIAGGENVAGYQATVVFDPDALIYFSSANSDYLSDGTFFTAPDVGENYVTLASAGAEGKNGDGTLATITFQVVDAKASRFFLSQASFVDPEGERLFPCIENGTVGDDTVKDSEVIEPVYRAEDINNDGVVNIQDLVLISANFGRTGENEADVNGDGVVDIVDLVKIAGAFGNNAGAPFSFPPQTLAMLSIADVQGWITQAQHLNLTDVTSQRGIRFLEQLLVVLTPEETILLPNYPNPFNPETWIPYQLANPSDVQIIIYDTRGTTIRHLTLGHQPAGYYT